MSLKTSKIQFHRRSRYEDILELVNDNEEALRPFPNRDAVFYKASNQGSYFDGRGHLDRLQVEQNRIAERVVRDHMMRQYAQENGMTHRALFREMGGERGGENAEAEEFLDLDEDQNYTRAELEGVLARAGEAQQENQGAIAEAHQQQLEQEQEQGEGILRRIGRGTFNVGRSVVGNVASNVGTVGRNIAGNLASGQDLATSVIAGVAQPALEGLAGSVMRRVLPEQRPLLDFDRAPRMPLPNLQPIDPQVLRPTLILQPHQPNVGPTQQPLALPAPAQQPLPPPEPEPTPAEQARFQEVGTSASRLRPKARPTPNYQQGGSSSSSGRAPPPPEEERPQPPRRRMTRKTHLKESARADASSPRSEQNLQPLIMPSKIGIQKLRETFEDASNKEAISKTTFRNYRSLYNQWVSSKGNPVEKKNALRQLQKLYRETVYERFA